MADGIVTNGTLATLAQIVGTKLRRRVVVHRVESRIKLPGRKVGTKTEIRYSIGIEGCHPPVFFGMTVNEAKARLAMLSDMLSSGVINAVGSASDATSGTGTNATRGDNPQSSHVVPELPEDKLFGEEPGDEGSY